jgi:hypothetical protein
MFSANNFELHPAISTGASAFPVPRFPLEISQVKSEHVRLSVAG